MPTQIKDIIICDDHFITVLGIEQVLTMALPTPFTVRKATSGGHAIELFNQLAPDLFITDIGLNDMTGLEVVKDLKKTNTNCLFFVLTGSDDPLVLQQAQICGAHAILRKLDNLENLIQAIQSIQNNPSELFIDSSVQSLLDSNAGQALSRREYEVLSLIVEGFTSQEIATKLDCSITTVKTYRTRIMNKSSTRNAAELMAWFLKGNVKRNASALA